MTRRSEGERARAVLITGVSSGLGHGLALEHLERGDRVLGLSRRTPEDLVERGLEFRPCDLTDDEATAAAVGDLARAAGAFDLVWLNAGRLGRTADMVEVDLGDMMRTMDVNVWANQRVLTALFRADVRVDRVVAISSGAAVSGSRGWSGYAISKAALNMLVELWAAERQETHFLALAPGLVDTAMQEAIAALPDDPRHPTLRRLREARGTAAMPAARDAARKVLDALPRLGARPSGAFVDVRA